MHKQKLLTSPQMDAILMWQRRPILQPTGPINGWPTQPRRKSLSNRKKQECWLEVGPKVTYMGRAMDTENKSWYAKIQICPNSLYKQVLTANIAADEIKLSTRIDPTSFIETTHCSDPHREAKITQRKGKKNIQEGGGTFKTYIYTLSLCMKPFAQLVRANVLLHAFVFLTNELGCLLICPIWVILPSNNKHKLSPPSATHKMMIHHQLDYVCIISGGNRLLRIIATGHRTALHILNVRLEAICLENLKSRGVTALIGDNLISVAPNPPTNLVRALPDALQLVKAPVIWSDLDPDLIALLKSLSPVLGCQVPGQAIMNRSETVPDLPTL